MSFREQAETADLFLMNALYCALTCSYFLETRFPLCIKIAVREFKIQAL
jgi:hypothetical protein